MNSKGLFGSTLFCALALAVTGCADPNNDDLEDDFEFRNGQLEFWEVGSNFDANGPIEVREGDDDDNDNPIGDILWDIDTAGVTQQTRGDTADTLVSEEDQIRDFDLIANTGLGVNCTGVKVGKKRYQLVEPDGSVVLTVWKRYVFMGDVSIPQPGGGAIANMLQNDVAFSFKQDHIYAGNWWSGDVIATADANLNKANYMRRMLLASLVSGECGGVGMPQ